MIHCFTSDVCCVDACCALQCLANADGLSCFLLHWILDRCSLGGASMAAVRAVAVFSAGTSSSQGVVLDVLQPSVSAGAGVPAPAPAAADHAATLAAARSLVASACADAVGARTHRVPKYVDGGAKRRRLKHWPSG